MSALGAMLQPELAGPGVDALSLSMPASGAEPLAEFGRKLLFVEVAPYVRFGRVLSGGCWRKSHPGRADKQR